MVLSHLPSWLYQIYRRGFITLTVVVLSHLPLWGGPRSLLVRTTVGHLHIWIFTFTVVVYLIYCRGVMTGLRPSWSPSYSLIYNAKIVNLKKKRSFFANFSYIWPTWCNPYSIKFCRNLYFSNILYDMKYESDIIWETPWKLRKHVVQNIDFLKNCSTLTSFFSVKDSR